MRHPYLYALLFALPYVLALWLGTPLNLAEGLKAGANALGGGDVSGGAILTIAAVPLGAFIASVPGRLRKKKQRRSTTVAQCLGCFAGGLLSMLGCLTAGGDFSLLLMTGAMTGTLSGLAFAGTACLVAVLCAALCERRRAA